MNNINALKEVEITQDDIDRAKRFLKIHDNFVKGFDIEMITEEVHYKGWFGKDKVKSKVCAERLPDGYFIWCMVDGFKACRKSWLISRLEFYRFVVKLPVGSVYLSDNWYGLLVDLREDELKELEIAPRVK